MNFAMFSSGFSCLEVQLISHGANELTSQTTELANEINPIEIANYRREQVLDTFYSNIPSNVFIGAIR